MSKKIMLTYPSLQKVLGCLLTASPALAVHKQRVNDRWMVLIQGMLCRRAVSSWRKVLCLEIELGQERVSAQEAEAQEQLVHLSFVFSVCPNPDGLDSSLALCTGSNTVGRMTAGCLRSSIGGSTVPPLSCPGPGTIQWRHESL